MEKICCYTSVVKKNNEKSLTRDGEKAFTLQMLRQICRQTNTWGLNKLGLTTMIGHKKGQGTSNGLYPASTLMQIMFLTRVHKYGKIGGERK